MMNNKKATTGNFTATFVATIVIAILILIFTFSASFLRSVIGLDTGESVFKEDSLGLESGAGYMENYIKLVDARSRVDEDLSLDEALLGVEYDKK
ncbi:hypothetical protein KAS08_03440 [Candidatus Pacearchaeota archaeon]|nr:hypothetical protein [Candidatus Pacearchaeota archaeon]